MLFGTLYNTVMLYVPAYLKNMDATEAKKNLNDKFMKALHAGICFWPLVSFFNFQYNVAHLRLPAMNLASFVYGVFLSYLSNRAVLQDKISGEF